MDPYEKQTVDWEELDKIKFYTYGFTLFMGVRALIYPPFVLKTKMQVERGGASMSAFRVARETVRVEGIRGLYKGFWISSSTLVFRQFYFTAYEVIRHRLGPKSEVYAYLGPETGEVVRNMVAGGASSIITQFFTVPVDIISQRMVVDGIQRGQAVSLARAGAAGGEAAVSKVEASGASALELEKARSTTAVTGGASEAEAIEARREGKSVVEARRHTTAREVARRVYSESGLRGFYRGFGVSVLQFAPTSAIWWTAYGLYSKAFLRLLGSFHPQQLPPLTAEQRQIGVQAAAGFCTGMTTVILTNPLDVLRTRLQVAGRRGDGRTLLSEYRALMAESGPQGFLRGLLPRMLAMAPTSVLILSVYELIKRLSRKTPAPLPSTSPGAAVSSGEVYS